MNPVLFQVAYVGTAAWALFTAPSFLDANTRIRGIVAWLVGIAFLLDGIRWGDERLLSVWRHVSLTQQLTEFLGILAAVFCARAVTEMPFSDDRGVRAVRWSLAAYFGTMVVYWSVGLMNPDFLQNVVPALGMREPLTGRVIWIIVGCAFATLGTLLLDPSASYLARTLRGGMEGRTSRREPWPSSLLGRLRPWPGVLCVLCVWIVVYSINLWRDLHWLHVQGES